MEALFILLYLSYLSSFKNQFGLNLHLYFVLTILFGGLAQMVSALDFGAFLVVFVSLCSFCILCHHHHHHPLFLTLSLLHSLSLSHACVCAHMHAQVCMCVLNCTFGNCIVLQDNPGCSLAPCLSHLQGVLNPLS